MAKKRRGSKSQAVRDYLKEHPAAGNKEVAEGLAAAGIKVTMNLVAICPDQLNDQRAGASLCGLAAHCSRGGFVCISLSSPSTTDRA
jgi:hypothetical protein